jgi:hypothetical protein
MANTDFIDQAAAAPTYGEVFLAEQPWFWIAVLLLGVLILWLGWHFGSTRGDEQRRADQRKIIDAIYDAINDKARIAAAAPRNKAVSAAHDLHEEIRKLLGSVVVLTPFGSRAMALKLALDGDTSTHTHGDAEAYSAEPRAAAHGTHDAHAGASTAGGDHGHGGSEAHPATAHSPPGAVGSQINISIAGGSGGGHGHGGATPPLDAVRRAVMDICDYWSRSTMKDELAAAQQALLRMPPPKLRTPAAH